MRERRSRHLPLTPGAKVVGALTDRNIKLMFRPDFDSYEERERAPIRYGDPGAGPYRRLGDAGESAR